jgi:hypothetical protein
MTPKIALFAILAIPLLNIAEDLSLLIIWPEFNSYKARICWSFLAFASFSFMIISESSAKNKWLILGASKHSCTPYSVLLFCLPHQHGESLNT